jgi:hypothetical protein
MSVNVGFRTFVPVEKMCVPECEKLRGTCLMRHEN